MLVLAAGCYGPNPNYLGIADDSSTTAATMSTATTATSDGSSTDDGSSSSTTDPTETTSDPTETTSDPTETTSDESETTDVPDPSCGDGNPDIGEFCYVSDNVSMLVQVESLAAGDFDDDGKLDLAVGRKDDVRVLFGDGLGGFPLQFDVPEPNGNYWGLAAGDLDGDTIADLVAANFESDDLLVWLSAGDGSFAAQVVHPVGREPMQLILTHADGDPFLDAVTALRGDDAVAVLLGDGLGGFGAPQLFASGGDQPLALGVGHIDPGNLMDVAVANLMGDELSVLLGTGPGQLGGPQPYQLAGRPRAAVIADFDLDGRVDVAVPLENVDRVALLFGAGEGDLAEPALELGVGDKPVGAAAARLDNDLAPDLLVLNQDAASVGVLLNDVDTPGQFGAHQTLVGLDNFSALAAIIVADFNADGVDDVIVGGSGVRAMVSNP